MVGSCNSFGKKAGIQDQPFNHHSIPERRGQICQMRICEGHLELLMEEGLYREEWMPDRSRDKIEKVYIPEFQCRIFHWKRHSFPANRTAPSKSLASNSGRLNSLPSGSCLADAKAWFCESMGNTIYCIPSEAKKLIQPIFNHLYLNLSESATPPKKQSKPHSPVGWHVDLLASKWLQRLTSWKPTNVCVPIPEMHHAPCTSHPSNPSQPSQPSQAISSPPMPQEFLRGNR